MKKRTAGTQRTLLCQVVRVASPQGEAYTGAEERGAGHVGLQQRDWVREGQAQRPQQKQAGCTPATGHPTARLLREEKSWKGISCHRKTDPTAGHMVSCTVSEPARTLGDAGWERESQTDSHLISGPLHLLPLTLFTSPRKLPGPGPRQTSSTYRALLEKVSCSKSKLPKHSFT